MFEGKISCTHTCVQYIHVVCTRSSRVTLFVVCDLLLEFGNLLSICFVLGSTCATQSWAPLDERLFP